MLFAVFLFFFLVRSAIRQVLTTHLVWCLRLVLLGAEAGVIVCCDERPQDSREWWSSYAATGIGAVAIMHCCACVVRYDAQRCDGLDEKYSTRTNGRTHSEVK